MGRACAMTPIDFVVFGGDSEPNTPVFLIHEAMNKPLRILGPNGEYEPIGYYFDDGQMVLDIRSKE